MNLKPPPSVADVPTFDRWVRDSLYALMKKALDTGGGGELIGPDLAAIEALTGQGVPQRASEGVWSLVSIGGGGGIDAEGVQDIVGAMLVDSASIDFTYSDTNGQATAVLKNTLGAPGTYGSATQVPVVTVGMDGRVTSITSVSVTVGGASADNRNIVAGSETRLIADGTCSVLSTYVDIQAGGVLEISSTGILDII